LQKEGKETKRQSISRNAGLMLRRNNNLVSGLFRTNKKETRRENLKKAGNLVTGKPIFLLINTLKGMPPSNRVLHGASGRKVHERKSSEKVIVSRRENALERGESQKGINRL
jgi:hypothetical protein